MTEGLKPCPFCGNADESRVVWLNAYTWRVHCGGCGADGPTCYSENNAVEWWNTRTADAPESRLPPEG